MISGAVQHLIRELPIVVLFPHNRCNCRCVMCDIWKIRQVRELTDGDLEHHLSSFRSLKVKRVVLSGGEPLMHSDLPALCRCLRREGMRITLLTAGLSIERHAATVSALVDDVIVSVDGPEEIHDGVRGIRGAFRQLERGLDALRRLQPEMPISGRCTVQKRNFTELRNTVSAAHALRLSSLSFLAADLTSTAFNRNEGWSRERQNEIGLAAEEVGLLDQEIGTLIEECRQDIESGFIVEKPEKLRKIGLHFRARLGVAQAFAPRCNAPWVSTVIEADGTVRPCFFQPPLGNIHARSLADILNAEGAVRFRQHLDVSTNPICRTCVCSLFVPDVASQEKDAAASEQLPARKAASPAELGRPKQQETAPMEAANRSVSMSRPIDIELYLRVREKEGRVYPDTFVKRLPAVPAGHPLQSEWKSRAASSERLTRYMAEKGNRPTVLDLGCGNGWLSHRMACGAQATVVGVDPNCAELRQACRVFSSHRNLSWVSADTFCAPFREGTFDFIVIASAIQYFADLPSLIAALKPLLTVCGEIHILDSPFYSLDELPAARERSHRYYEKLGFPEMAACYHHHDAAVLAAYSPTWLYVPERESRGSAPLRDSPFPWVRLRR